MSYVDVTMRIWLESFQVGFRYCEKKCIYLTITICEYGMRLADVILSSTRLRSNLVAIVGKSGGEKGISKGYPNGLTELDLILQIRMGIKLISLEG
jgi:hypothetical protein